MKKIADLPSGKGWSYKDSPRCRHPEHNPPTHLVLEPGIYEYECPGCGRKRMVRVDGVELAVR